MLGVLGSVAHGQPHLAKHSVSGDPNHFLKLYDKAGNLVVLGAESIEPQHKRAWGGGRLLEMIAWREGSQMVSIVIWSCIRGFQESEVA